MVNVLPSVGVPKAVAVLASELADLQADLGAEQRRAVELDGQLHEAVQADRGAYAEALRRHLDDPGTEHEDAVRAQLALSARRQAGLEEACARVTAELRVALDQHRDTWV